ncbi:MAG: hypothetical protein ACR2GK_07730 [Gemmatimonadaceae bacterium]
MRLELREWGNRLSREGDDRAAASRILRKAWMSQPWSAGMFRTYLRHALPLPLVTMVSGAAGTLRRM